VYPACPAGWLSERYRNARYDASTLPGPGHRNGGVHYLPTCGDVTSRGQHQCQHECAAVRARLCIARVTRSGAHGRRTRWQIKRPELYHSYSADCRLPRRRGGEAYRWLEPTMLPDPTLPFLRTSSDGPWPIFRCVAYHPRFCDGPRGLPGQMSGELIEHL